MNSDIIPVATGDKWIGYGVRSSSSVIRDLIMDAKKEVVLTAYILTNQEIVSQIKQALDRGISVIVYMYIDRNPNSFQITKAVTRLYDLKEEYPYLKIIEVRNVLLHAKVIISDGHSIYCGSANLSNTALESNYELGFLVRDGNTAGKMCDLLQKLEDT